MTTRNVIAGLVIAAAATCVAGRQSHATPVVVGGQLVGATGVVVAGVGTFDVSFEEGTCVAIFGDCDAVADFDFDNEDDARAAAQALVDQVFLDVGGLFDTDTELTAGCTSTVECQAAIPFALISGTLVSSGIARNISDAGADGVSVSNIGIALDTTSLSNLVYARFTSAGLPEPGTSALLGPILAALAFARRRSGKSA